MSTYAHEDQGDVRTAQLLTNIEEQADTPLRFRVLDERTDGAQVFRLLWDSMSEVLPIAVAVIQNNELVHIVRVEASEWREAYAHPWAYGE